MASKDTCCSSNPGNDWCGVDNLCLPNDDIRVECKSGERGGRDGGACLTVNVDYQADKISLEKSFDDERNTWSVEADKSGFLNDNPKKSCCEKKECIAFMDSNAAGIGESHCKEDKVIGFKDKQGMIGGGQIDRDHYGDDGKEGELESCCGGKEVDSCFNEVNSEVVKGELCLDSCCGKQNDNEESSESAKTGESHCEKSGNSLDSCCDKSRPTSCCEEKVSKTCAAKKNRFGVSPATDTEDCCSAKTSCKDKNLASSSADLKEKGEANVKFGEKAATCCESLQQNSTCCDEEVLGEGNDDCCETTSLVQMDDTKKGSTTPTHFKELLSGMGNVVSYGSTAKSAGKSDGRKFLDVHGHKYTALPGAASDTDIDTKDDVEIPVSEPHIKTTKFRVQNICCGKEAELMKRELEPINGISAVSVNIVGRVGFVRHDNNIITASDIVSILNKLHLGVSIMESANHEDEHLLRKEVIIRLSAKSAILIVLLALFMAVIIGNVKKYSWEKWVAIVEIVVGVLPILRKIGINLMKKVFIDINLLMLIAVAGTVALREWVEGATLVFVFAVAEVLQQYCTYKVQSAISGIMVQLPDKAVLAETGKSVAIDEIEIGTRIIVCAGEKIALDGEVVKGQASVDESSITGEAMPIEKGPQSKTYSGTIVQNGYLEIKTTSNSKTSTVSKVTQMVQEAQAKSSHTEKMMNKFAKIYTPLVLITALLVFAVPAILAELKVGRYESQLHWWGIRALIVLLIACPCALVMSVPIPVVCGIAAAAKNGALVKSGTDMETLARIKDIAFDKTGTLTEGRFKVVNIKEFRDDMKYREMLELVAALEVKSSHPVASALVNHYSGCITDKIANFGASVGLPDVTKFTTVPGYGLKGTVSNHHVVVGNIKMMRQSSVHVSLQAERLFGTWADCGQTVIFCSIDGQLSLMIGLADTPRATARVTVQILKDLGISTVILTGDCSGAAAAVMKATGAENYIASMKPEHKLEWIRNCQRPSPKTRTKVAMIGDGVNDGPSLAAADVGIAIGACATALAIESAGVALMSDSLTKIPELLVLSRFTRRVVKQNIGLALVIKFAVMIATMTGSLALWMAVLSDVAALILVILNGIRPLFWKRGDMDEAGNMKEASNADVEVLDQDGDQGLDGVALIEIKS